MTTIVLACIILHNMIVEEEYGEDGEEEVRKKACKIHRVLSKFMTGRWIHKDIEFLLSH